MASSRKAWYANKFDLFLCALVGPLAVAAFVFLKLGQGGILPLAVGQYLFLAVGVLLLINVVFALVVVHKNWGWLLLPVFALVRVFATLMAVLCGLLSLAMFAYQASSNEKKASAWTQDNRSSRYREGVKDGETADSFGGASGSLWGWLVLHTLAYC